MFKRSKLRLLGAVVLLSSLSLTVAPTASADYASVQDRAVWKPIDGQVFALWQVGDRMFAGGGFSGVKRQLSDTNTVNQQNLAAFDVNSGALIQTFNPVFDGAVREIISSSDDSRIFVGGDFTSVNGLPNTARLVALNPTTGAVDTNFLGNANGPVYDLEIHGNDLYVGGKFSRVGTGSGGRLARLDATTGQRDPTFNPLPDYYVDTMDIPLAGDRLYVGGTFQTIDGRDGNQFVALDLQTGATVSSFRTPYDQRIYDIAATDERITATYGSRPNAIGVFDRNGKQIERLSDGDGDYQVAVLNGDRTLVGGHSRRTDKNDRPGLVSLVTQTGKVDSLRIDVFTPRGVWDIYPTGGALWLGGDIRRVDGESAGLMVRIPMAPGQIAPSTPNVPSASTSSSSITLDWNDSTDTDGSVIGYRVIRSGEQIASVTSSNFTDTSVVPGVNYAYNIEAIDNGRNVSGRTRTLVASTSANSQAPTAPGNVMVTNVGDSSVALSWSASTAVTGPISYIVERDGTPVATTSSRTYTDTGLNPQTTYRYTIRATDGLGNQSSASTPVHATTLPGTQPGVIDLLRFGDTWKYNASGSNLQRTWIAAAYDDAGWSTGPAELGFGDGDEATVIPPAPSPSLTTYFRRTFAVADVNAVTSLALRVVRDDGVAVYINGVEVGRDNLAANANYDTKARTALSGSAETTPVLLTVSPSALVTGTNTIAVEVHNSSFSSSDLSFDLELRATVAPSGNIDTQAPSAPRSLTVSSVATGLNLNWQASSDNVGVTGYSIVRDGVWLAAVSSLSYVDATVKPAQAYSYVVVATDAAGNLSPASNAVSFVTPGPVSDTTPPVATFTTPASNHQIFGSGPVGLAGLATDDSSGVVRVQAAVQNRSTKHWLQTNGTFSATFNLLDATLVSPGATATTWTLTVAVPAGDYVAQIRSVDGAGNGQTVRPSVPFSVSP